MIKIDAEDLKRTIEKLKNDTVEKREFLFRVSEKGKQDLKERAKTSSATGNLANSITTEVNNDNARIYSSLEYSNIALETGRKPGKRPPVDALRRWARLKLGDSDLAFMVARKIGAKGTPSKKYVSQTIDKLGQIIPEELSNFFNKLIR